MKIEPATSQAVADPATEADDGEVSQVSQSQPEEFPIFWLPEPVLSLVLEAAPALGVDWAMVAGPCLVALAGCIGNRRRIILKDGWCEACVLWIAIVIRSGGKKTPTLGLVLQYLQEREAAEVEEEKARQQEYDKVMQEWKFSPKDDRGDPPEKPEPFERLIVSDITTEALLAVHERSPLGLLVCRDELGGWFQGFNQYKAGGKGSDSQTWTEMHQGSPALVDRKGSATLSVPRAAVSIVGGIQPELLRKEICGDHLYDGIASRLLFVVPNETPDEWTEDTVSEATGSAWNALLDQLLALRPNNDGTPFDLPLTDEAKAAWVEYYKDHGQRAHEEDGPMRAAMSKLKATTARLALVIQLSSDPQSLAVGVDAMKAGIEISKWFEGQARRVYEGFKETEQEKDRRELCDWIRKHGGKTTIRQLANGGPYRFRKRAKEALADLESAGLVKRIPRAGRGSEEYMLCAGDGGEVQ
jgi:uncharacterized protein DUF3987